MKKIEQKTIDGNSAASYVAYAFSEVAAIYPITPSSPMGQYADVWSATGRKNIFGETVDVIEMQSEAGAAGAVHGTLSGGAMTTTFTASQGLMLMLPNMHKIAGEMLPTVFHVSARSLAAQSLSIFGDHSDVMSARNTGFALMATNSIQEIQDLAIVSHLATLKTKIPFLNFFDGFRNSHEIQKIEMVDYETMQELSEPKYVEEFRGRALNSENPFVKVGAQNPDVYFQGREASNKYYLAAPEIIQNCMDKVSKTIGRDYHLFDYSGSKDAEKIIIAMGSGCDTIEETISYLNKNGENLGLLKVRLYRPFSVKHLLSAIPKSVKKIAVLDRTKEPGSIGDPLYLDVIASFRDNKDITIIGGRYGLSSKEFTPSMVKAVYNHLAGKCTHGFTVGIEDDVTNNSIKIDETINTTPEGTITCKFWGLGSDGTVGANKNSIKIIGDNTEMYAQGYFQYDSKKSGGITRSHLRFGKEKIQSEYLVESPYFVACHNPAFIGRYDILEGIKDGGIFLLNSQWESEIAFENLTKDMQETIINKKINFFNINALEIAQKVGLGSRINTVMQAAFFIISEVLEKDKAIAMIKEAIQKSYIKKGKNIVESNWKAVDATNEALVKIDTPDSVSDNYKKMDELVSQTADTFTKTIIEPIMREKGDDIKVSEMPFDGCIPSGTSMLEKRGVATSVPHWNAEKCIQCNQCSIVCPHASIRPKLMTEDDLKNAPDTFNTIVANGKDKNKYLYRLQVYVEDCQECGICVNECPVNALEMVSAKNEKDAGQIENQKFFTSLPEDVLGSNKLESVKGSQFKQPLLEFSGACAGCGETPYAKLLTQLFGDRMMIANATGCSSIWGGTFPTIPYCKNKNGDGPSWANSLFEDNAEYGFGMRLAVDANRKQLKTNTKKLLKANISDDLKKELNYALENWEAKDEDKRLNTVKIKSLLASQKDSIEDKFKATIIKVIELKNYFMKKSVWAFGGDGWAYDIGYGGVDHVLATGKDINILVMDTEVYSNTGGQASKASPLGSIAKFAEAGKETIKKDLGMMIMSYGYVYVASIALGANKAQALKAIKEAEDFDGPSLILAYAPCINHGIDMSMAIKEEKKAVDTGYWLLYRYHPELKNDGKNPLILDSKEPKKSVLEFLDGEKRYSALKTTFPERVDNFRNEFVKYTNERYNQYKKMADE